MVKGRDKERWEMSGIWQDCVLEEGCRRDGISCKGMDEEAEERVTEGGSIQRCEM